MTTETAPPPQSVFPGSKVATNMPFFDGVTLAFCQSAGDLSVNIPTTGTIWKRMEQNKALAERFKNLPRHQKVIYRPWKLAYCNWSDKTVHSIVTGFPANIIERSPAFYREGDQVHLSFISGKPTSAGFFYRLYTASGPDLGHLQPPQPVSNDPTYFGFISPHHVCSGTMNIIRLSEKVTGHTFRLRTSLHRVSSVTFRADDPAKLVITGILNTQHECHTVLYDLATGTTSDISVGGSIYKASMYGNEVVFAQKHNITFEDRELYHGEAALSPSIIQISKEK